MPNELLDDDDDDDDAADVTTGAIEAAQEEPVDGCDADDADNRRELRADDGVENDGVGDNIERKMRGDANEIDCTAKSLATSVS